MSDLIRRQDAELILAREMYATALENGCDPVSPVDFLPEAKAWMSDAPTIRGWIPCSERLPEMLGKYLVTRKWKDNSGEEHITVMTSWYKQFGVIGLDWQDFGVLAWQPLPTPYREEIDE